MTSPAGGASPRSASTEASFGARYASKVTAGGVGLVVSLVSQVLIIRSLGPAHFGNFSFLAAFFGQWIDFFDSGASLCFYNRLSQRRENPLIRFNWEFIGLIGVAVAVGVGAVGLFGGRARVWPDQDWSWIWSALLLAFLLKVVQTAGQIIDAFGHTVEGERARTVQRAVALLLLAALCGGGAIRLPTFFGYNAVVATLLLAAWWEVLRKKNLRLFPADPLTAAARRGYAREYWTYSHPLILYCLAGFAANVMDRWLLQTFAGSLDQGFFGFSFQWSSVCFLFSGAMVPLIMREFALAFQRNDTDDIRRRFERYVPLLYSVTGFLAAFVAVEARTLAGLAGGARFRDAAAPLAVMAFYPLHQMLGQVCGSYFYATDRTKAYRNVGIVGSLLGLAGSYFLLAPPARGGLGAGALGLAVKTVLFNAATTNVLLWVIARSLKMRFSYYLRHQVVTLLFWTALAALSGGLSARWIPGAVGSLAAAATLYGALATVAMAVRPAWIGVSPEDARRLFAWAGEALRLRPRAV
ncbi:MAG: oligosaccharide flippase family protein [Elusimicrobia bacterium]|nr:oligosaccharide flippase family protein [Elusimicrobiota bacterium]